MMGMWFVWYVMKVFLASVDNGTFSQKRERERDMTGKGE